MESEIRAAGDVGLFWCVCGKSYRPHQSNGPHRWLSVFVVCFLIFIKSNGLVILSCSFESGFGSQNDKLVKRSMVRRVEQQHPDAINLGNIYEGAIGRFFFG